MPKTVVADWSTTAGSNTDVGGINIDEGMNPSAVNNAMREMMAQIKAAHVEQGSNANGEYVRFDDGTQICSHKGGTTRTTSTAVGSVFLGSIADLFTFPAAFIASPKCTPFADRNFTTSGTPWAILGNGYPGTTETQVFIMGALATNTARTGYIAVGRWK